ncbi:HU family DNA-binding protein [Bacteroides sp. OttesenSCG-928-J23]|nr:HU family DNA-binding protein [Bacteroides sp. OttesenSCG-928-N06]MDL2247994.1 HU family DNA-binding protein [Bacteroides sp. OttesenSCG-928-J23]
MNKAELTKMMAEKSGLTKTDSVKALNAFMETVAEALKSGDKISLIGFGTFLVNERAERTGVNPSTKQQITIPARKVVKFKAGAELSGAVE